MKTSELCLAILTSLTSFLVTAAPLPLTCQCTTALPNSPSSIVFCRPRLQSCELLCEKFSETVSLVLDEIEEFFVPMSLKDLDAVLAPIEATARPLPTSVLMQLSSQSENKKSAPLQTAMPTLCQEVVPGQEDRPGGCFGHAQVQAQIDDFAQRHLVVILLGLLGLSMVAVAIVELFEKLFEPVWKR